MLYATVRQRKIYVKKPETVIQNGIGVDQITLNMDDEWARMHHIVYVLTLRFPSEKQKVDEEDQPVVDENGEPVMEPFEDKVEIGLTRSREAFGEPLPVPWKCLEHTGLLSLNCTGYDEAGEVRMTTMLADSYWTVVQNGPLNGEVVGDPPTLTLVEQTLAAAATADAASIAANRAAAQILAAKERGEFDGVSPTIEIGTVREGLEPSVVNSGTERAVRLDFVLPRGANGRGVQSMTADGNTLTVRYTDGTSQSFSIQTAGVSSWNDLKDKPNMLTNIGYNEATGKLSLFFNNGFFPTGELDISRTLVKGEDYWTEEDVAQIKAYVDEAILGGAW